MGIIREEPRPSRRESPRADILFTGISGTAYRYGFIDEGVMLVSLPGNYVFVRDTPRGPVIVYAGECQNLATDLQVNIRWATATEVHKCDKLFTHMGIADEGNRRAERDDIVRAYLPPMNL
jgi:hypothetical protein